MKSRSRRRFLAEVGQGMLVAGLGASVATDLGIAVAAALDEDAELQFGKLEPLVDLMAEVPLDSLQPRLVEQLNSGVPLKTLVAAGALANARHFGGEDYVGFHTMMALMPAWHMAEELPKSEQPLPILKVLYRNTARIHESGGRDKLQVVTISPDAQIPASGEALYAKMCQGDMEGAEQVFAALSQRDRQTVYNALQPLVQDAPDVHRVALAWRAWDVAQLTGYEHATTLLRQSVRYCVDAEQNRLARHRPEPPLRKLLPRLLDEFHLLDRPLGTRKGDIKWITELAHTFFSGTRDQAAEAAAAALAEGYAPEQVGEAISLGANLLVLHDPGRAKDSSPDKPRGSVHGASVGVHASDAANAWRNIARVVNRRNAICSLIVGAWHTAGQSGYTADTPFPYDAEPIKRQQLDQAALLQRLAEAVEAKEQSGAMAVVQAWHDAGLPPQPVFGCLRQYAISEDGALHAEKYYRTVVEEYQKTRSEFRWRHLIGLARVTASEYGWPAPGREQARTLLGLS